MERRKLNEKVSEYKRTGSDEVFTDIYKACINKIEYVARQFAKESSVPFEEFISEAHLRLVRAVETYDEDKAEFFDNYVVKSMRLNFSRIVRDYPNKEDDSYYVDDEGNEASIFEEVEIEGVTGNAENDSIELLRSQESRSLVRDLTKDADTETKRYVQSFLQGNSLRSIASENGTNHNQVRRKLRRLARNFEPSKHGKVSDYMGVTR